MPGIQGHCYQTDLNKGGYTVLHACHTYSSNKGLPETLELLNKELPETDLNTLTIKVKESIGSEKEVRRSE
jgi:hypothetical protein